MAEKCCEKSVTKAYLGGDADISCKYPPGHKHSIKYLCKEGIDSKTCDHISSDENPSPRSRVFTVTITDLAEDAAGTYWCGVKRGERYVALITQVQLQITRE